MRRTTRVIGHYAPWSLSALLVAFIVVTLVLPVSAVVPWPVLAAALVLALFLGAALRSHNRGLCERCIASLPLDASMVANRYARRFRVAHLFENKLFAVCYLIALVAASFLYDHPIGRFGWAVAAASLVYLLSVYVTHQRLQPWCPYCRGGGEHQVSPSTPTPVSSQF